MPSLYDVSAEAQNDLFEIWRRIAEDSVDLANRMNGEFYDLFASLGRMPGQGHARKDLTARSWWHISRMCLPSASWLSCAASGM
jgi:plasmid stabilization system protein ParE